MGVGFSAERSASLRTTGPLCGAARREDAGWEVIAEVELALVPGAPMVLTAPPAIASADFDARDRMIVRGGDGDVAILAADLRPLWSSQSAHTPVSTLRGDEWVVFAHRGMEFRSQLPGLRASIKVGEGAKAQLSPMTPIALAVDLTSSQCVLAWRGVVPAVPFEALGVELLHHGAPMRGSSSEAPAFDATMVLTDGHGAEGRFAVTVQGGEAQSMKAPFPMAEAGAGPGEGQGDDATMPGAPWSDEEGGPVVSPAPNLESTVCLGEREAREQADAAATSAEPEASEDEPPAERAEAEAIERERRAEAEAADARRDAEEARFRAEQQAAALAEQRRRSEDEQRRNEQAAKLKSDLYGGFKRRP